MADKEISPEMQVLTSMQISELTKVIPANRVTLFARDYLELSDTEIANAANILPTTVYDMSYNVLTTWSNQQPFKPTVGDLLSRVAKAASEGAITSDKAFILLSQHCHSDSLTRQLMSSIAMVFSESEMEVFSNAYLNIPTAQCRSFMKVKADDLSATSEGIIRTWMNKQPTTVHQQPNLHHFCSLLAKLKQDHGCIEENLTALEQKLSDEQYSKDMAEVSRHHTAFLQLEAILQRYYKKHCRYMRPVCWSDDDNNVLEMDKFFISLKTSECDHGAADSKRLKSESVPMEELLSRKTHNDTEAKYFLIEGAAGSGKSTLCDKLAWDWSWGRDEIKGLNKFSLFFVIRVCDFKQQETVVEYIQRVLCPLSSGQMLTLKVIEEIIYQKQEQVLIVLDGLDESAKVLPGISSIINGEVIDCSTVIATARYGTPGKLKKNFELLLEIDKLTPNSIEKFIKLYDETFSVGELLDQNARLFELSTTPLLLTLLCISFPRRLHEQAQITQTLLLNHLAEGLRDKVRAKFLYESADCDKAFASICKTAYECLLNETVDICTSLNSIQERLGFVKLTGSVSFHDKKYSFTHKLLQEYLAANYIITENNYKDVDGIIRSVMTIPEVKNEESRQTSMLVVFVCGLLAKYKGDVIHFMSAVLPPIVYDMRDDFDCHVGHSRHLPLQCISEVRDMITDIPAITDLSDKYPDRIELNTSKCDSNCLQGAKILTTHNKKKIEVCVFVCSVRITDAASALLRDIVQSAATNTLQIVDDQHFATFFEPGGVYDGVPLSRLDLYRCSASAVSQHNVPSPSDTLVFAYCTAQSLMPMCKRLVGGELKRLIISDVNIAIDMLSILCGHPKNTDLTGINLQRHDGVVTLSFKKSYIPKIDFSLYEDLLQTCSGHISEVILYDITIVGDDSLCELTPTRTPGDLRVDVIEMFRCSSQLCVRLIQNYGYCLVVIMLSELKLTDDDITSLVAALANTRKVQDISVYELGEKQSIFMSALADTRIIHSLPLLGISVSCEEDLTAAKQLVCAAKQLTTLWLYSYCKQSEGEQSACKLLCTAGNSLHTVYSFAISPANLLAAVGECNDRERSAIQWEKVEMCDLNLVPLEGDWDQRLKELLPNYTGSS